MLLPALLALTTLMPRLDAGFDAMRTQAAVWERALAGAEAETPRYAAAARAVSNWRVEAGQSLRPIGLAMVARYAEREPAFVSRCVRLNNYWCIKRARWPGEIGGDDEGHTAFADAPSGADAAVALLSRYYREFGRRSALAIVRRWAPAECRFLGAPQTVSKTPTPLAPRGLAGTVRAKYLARHFRGGAPRRIAALRGRGGALRVQPWSARARLAGRTVPRAPLPMPKPVPDIASGIVHSSPIRVASAPSAASRDPLSPERLLAESAALPSIVAALPGGLLDLGAPAPFCSTDETRIGNYAARIAQSVGLKPGDDLKLFSPEGLPLPNLAPVLLAMSSVELGTLHAGADLVAAAIARRFAP